MTWNPLMRWNKSTHGGEDLRPAPIAKLMSSLSNKAQNESFEIVACLYGWSSQWIELVDAQYSSPQSGSSN